MEQTFKSLTRSKSDLNITYRRTPLKDLNSLNLEEIEEGYNRRLVQEQINKRDSELTIQRKTLGVLEFLTSQEEVKIWMQEALERQFEKDFVSTIKDGTLLCELANRIQPQSIRRIHSSRSPAFLLMENIQFFLDAAAKLGVHRAQLFSPLDLYEEKNIPKVVNLLVVVAELAKKRGFKTVLQPLSPDVEFTAEEVHRAEEILQKAEQPIPLPTPMSQQALSLPPPQPEQPVEQQEQQAPVTSQEPEAPAIEPPPVFKPAQDDQVDQLLAEFITSQHLDIPMPEKVTKIGWGNYKFGERIEVTLKCINGHLVARVGGGWMRLEDYLSKYFKYNVDETEIKREVEKDVLSEVDTQWNVKQRALPRKSRSAPSTPRKTKEDKMVLVRQVTKDKDTPSDSQVSDSLAKVASVNNAIKTNAPVTESKRSTKATSQTGAQTKDTSSKSSTGAHVKKPSGKAVTSKPASQVPAKKSAPSTSKTPKASSTKTVTSTPANNKSAATSTASTSSNKSTTVSNKASEDKKTAAAKTTAAKPRVKSMPPIQSSSSRKPPQIRTSTATTATPASKTTATNRVSTKTPATKSNKENEKNNVATPKVTAPLKDVKSINRSAPSSAAKATPARPNVGNKPLSTPMNSNSTKNSKNSISAKNKKM